MTFCTALRGRWPRHCVCHWPQGLEPPQVGDVRVPVDAVFTWMRSLAEIAYGVPGTVSSLRFPREELWLPRAWLPMGHLRESNEGTL